MSEPATLADRRMAPVASIVETIEELLALAKSGRLRAFAWVTVKPGGYVAQAWDCEGPNMHNLMSATTILQHRMAHELYGESTTEDIGAE